MRSALSLTTASRSPFMASMTTSTASSASFFAILLRPDRNSRAVRDVDGSSCRQASAAWYRREIESLMAPPQYRDLVAIVLIAWSLVKFRRSFFLGQEAGVAADRGGVDGDDLLGRKAPQVIRPAGLRAGAGEMGAAERLGADNRADHAAIDIDIPVNQTRNNPVDRAVDTRMNAERQRGAVGGDVVKKRIQRIGAPAHDMEDGTEDLRSQIAGPIEFDDGWADIEAGFGQFRIALPPQQNLPR